VKSERERLVLDHLERLEDAVADHQTMVTDGDRRSGRVV
jgi:hypothetical protein